MPKQQLYSIWPVAQDAPLTCGLNRALIAQAVDAYSQPGSTVACPVDFEDDVVACGRLVVSVDTLASLVIDSMIGISLRDVETHLLAIAAELEPNGYAVIVVDPVACDDGLVDVPGLVARHAGTLGLDLVDRNVALLCKLDGDELVPPDHDSGVPSARSHHDIVVLHRPAKS